MLTDKTSGLTKLTCETCDSCQCAHRPPRIRTNSSPSPLFPPPPSTRPWRKPSSLFSPPSLHLAATTPGNGVSRLSVTSARSAVRACPVSRRNVRLKSLSVRCEQGGGGGGGLDVWLSRGAMLGFVGAITVELTTGKGVLQNVGLAAPLPTVALVLTGVVGVATAFVIFQSASRD